MKIHQTRLLSFFLLFSCFYSSFATTYTSNSDGNWTTPTTWNPNGIPGENDDVIINDSIHVNTKIKVGSITMTNDDNSHAILTLNSTDTFQVIGNFSATAGNFGYDLDIQVRNNTLFIVNGNFTIDRNANNATINKVRFYQFGDSKTYILGDLNFYYRNSENNEDFAEVFIAENSIFDVQGKTNFLVTGGKNFSMRVTDSGQAIFRDSFSVSIINGNRARIISDLNGHIQALKNVKLLNDGGINSLLRTGTVGGKITLSQNLYLENTTAGDQVFVKVVNNTSEINVLGDIIMDAFEQNTIGIQIDSGFFNLGGDILRPNTYGFLSMGNDVGELVFNGTNPQTFPVSKLTNSGTDSLYFGKVCLENTSSSPMTLTEDFRVQDTLFLAEGNLLTSSSAKLILEDNAVISGGSENSYIEGPVTKMGRSNGSDLFLPVGTDTEYSPITLSTISSSSSEVTVQYFGDPPPWGDALYYEPGVNNISGNGYWDVTKNASTGDLDITAFWTDAQAQGIQDLNSLVVVGLDGTTWRSYGQESHTGGTGSGVGGSVTSAYSDPPPFGIVLFTIGSVSELNQLPVELTKFNALQQGNTVGLNWETASEINSSHYIIERSTDGVSFERLATEDAQGDITTVSKYFYTDKNPNNGWNYYRLKIVDQDQSFEYSPIEVIKYDVNANFIIYPNPVRKMINIQGHETFDTDAQIEVFDRSGKLIFSGKAEFDGGNFQSSPESLNVKLPGTYFIRLTGKNESQVLKFVKFE